MDPVVGRVKFVITEGPEYVEIGRGEKDVRLSEIAIEGKRNTRGNERAMEIYREMLGSSPPPTEDAKAKVLARIKEEMGGGAEDWKAEVGPVWFNKAVGLDSTFSMAINEHPEEVRAGFGMSANRQDQRTFSWEWFTVAGEDRAEKLQEAGTLKFALGNTALGEEIVYTKFMSDISFRVKPMDSTDPSPFNPKWRVNVLRGSEIHWPSLVEGVVVANGTML